MKNNNLLFNSNFIFNRTKLEMDLKEKKEVTLGFILINDRTFLVQKMNNGYLDMKNNLEITLNNSLKDLNMFLYHLKFDYITLINDKKTTKLIEFIENSNKKKTFGENISLKLVIYKLNLEEITLKKALFTIDTVLNYVLNNKKYNDRNIITNDKFIEIFDLIKKEKDVYYEIEEALKNDSIIVYKQGIGDKNDNINKYECLVRMDVKGEIKSPFHFLDVARKYNLYTQISKKVIEKSFKYFNDKNDYFSINLTSTDFKDYSVLKCLLKHIKNYKNDKFIIEITETEDFTLEDLKVLNKLRDKYNVLISIDDFGTGFSNFTNITKLKANYLKIDGSIIKDIHISKENQKILKNICQLAKDFNLKVVAEYVSSKEISDFLKDYEIEYFQGFYISKPIFIEEEN